MIRLSKVGRLRLLVRVGKPELSNITNQGFLNWDEYLINTYANVEYTYTFTIHWSVTRTDTTDHPTFPIIAL